MQEIQIMFTGFAKLVNPMENRMEYFGSQNHHYHNFQVISTL